MEHRIRKCIYCKSLTNKLSNEHIISASVGKVLLGDSEGKIRNIVSLNDKKKFIIDSSVVIKDVCSNCNNVVLNYDNAGKKLAQKIKSISDLQGKSLDIDHKMILWLLKTHGNILRFTKDNVTGDKHVLNEEFLGSLYKDNFNDSEVALFIGGFRGKSFYWDANNSRRRQMFSFESITIIPDNLIFSFLRIKCLDTMLVFPRESKYNGNFGESIINSLEFLKDYYKVDLPSLVLNIHQKEIQSIKFLNLKSL